jgi:hypothetical protein
VRFELYGANLALRQAVRDDAAFLERCPSIYNRHDFATARGAGQSLEELLVLFVGRLENILMTRDGETDVLLFHGFEDHGNVAVAVLNR